MNNYARASLAIVVIGLATLATASKDYTAWDLIAGQGYPVEYHETKTQDGYHVSAYRMPREGATPVLFVHGLLCSALGWVANLHNSSLPFLFYDAGYDVWVANTRGTSNATGHDSLDLDSAKYWDWSFVERGRYDIPALVDLATGVAHSQSLVLVAHSEGTTESFIALSMVPELRTKVSFFMALAPVVSVRDTQSWMFKLMRAVNVNRLFNMFDIHKICGTDRLSDKMGQLACRLVPGFCETVFSSIGGWNKGNMDRNRYDVYVAATDCTSAKDLVHGMQLSSTNQLCLFDYGLSQNRERYGTDAPPLVPIGDITTPTAVFYGGNDIVVVPEDVEKYTIPRLNPQALARFPPRRIDSWNHLDFMWSADPTEFHHMVDVCKQIVKPSLL
eukprot:m51a1_g20 hypothetical protein (388) ;mRNA; f:90523-91961